ncbi:hypothetical protein NPIL_666691 [Nephila pilipes]|uniref:Uncharacterized protein n=1 Tax=Nephila pilipes TaxID=299642 RepID=A0A8X6MPJ1_NEPPI|nr:hypothetical protein NPIL_666691 [Nephila pilipes]
MYLNRRFKSSSATAANLRGIRWKINTLIGILVMSNGIDSRNELIIFRCSGSVVEETELRDGEGLIPSFTRVIIPRALLTYQRIAFREINRNHIKVFL